MLQLQNRTPFAATILPLADENGIDCLYINVKATFKIGQQWILAEEQRAPQAEDVYWGEPGKSSLKYASDIHLGKAATDVVVIGQACAPGGKPVAQLDVGLNVGSIRKVVRVFGDRVWRNGYASSPEPFETMPMVYERAFGGQHINGTNGQVIAAEERNPVGRGFAGRRTAREMEGQPLPNLEDPQQLIRDIKDQPEPACFGFRAPNWQPRVQHAGTYDAQWQRQRAPFMPLDYNSRFNNAAHPALVADGFLQGGEAVTITNMHPAGELRFALPCIRLAAQVDMDGTVEKPPLHLETLLLEPNQLQLSLVWKGKIRCGKKLLKVKQASLHLSR